jgi:hypothetical protein
VTHGMWYVGMWVCDMLYVDMLICEVVCWYGDKYWKCGFFVNFFGKSQKWTKTSAIRKKYGHIENLKVWPYNM